MALPVYTDALEFLEEERDAWAPFEALEGLSDADLERPTDPEGPAHGWSGRDLAGHLLAWQLSLLAVVKELALGERSATLEGWEAEPDHDMDSLNARWLAEWRTRPLAEVRQQLRDVPGELRGYLTVVPEARWLKDPRHLQVVLDDTLDHYLDHQAELAEIVAGASA